MEKKGFCSADARIIVQRVVASVSAGFERDALLILAGETLREASDWLHSTQTEVPEVTITPARVSVLPARRPLP